MKILTSVVLAMAMSVVAGAQQAAPATKGFYRQQVSLLGGVQATRKTNEGNLTYAPTSSGVFSLGYGYSLKRWLGLELAYDGTFNSQKYVTSIGSERMRTSMQGVSGSAVFAIPNPMIRSMHSFMTVGAGDLLFKPRDEAAGKMQYRPALVIGGGADVPLSQHLALRIAARSYVYKAPELGLVSLSKPKISSTVVPMAGLVVHF